MRTAGRCLGIAWIAVGLLGGCTSVRLRERTVHQGGTLPELQFRQVLDNLARFSEDPATLPWHVNLKEGTSQVTDSGSGGIAVELGPPPDALPQLFGSRTVVAQWGMAPVVDPTELRLLRFAYRRAVGVPEMPGPEFLEELAHELKGQLPNDADLTGETTLVYGYLARESRDARDLDAHVATANDDEFLDTAESRLRQRTPLVKNVSREVRAIQKSLAQIRPGWFHSGRRRDVPRDACYVGKCGNRYTWVCADGREALAEFTLTILRYSSLIKETQTLISPGSVKFSPGDRGG